MARVALIGENSIEYIETLLDIWNCGDCAVLVDWRIPVSTAHSMMTEAGITKCYIDQRLFESEDFGFDSKIEFQFYNRNTVCSTLLPQSIYNRFKSNYSNREAVIIYSSGTTGKSKGVILSHKAIQMNADAIYKYICPSPCEVFAIVKSLSHSSTLVGELLVALKYRIPVVVFSERLFPGYVFKACGSFGVSIFFINPQLLTMFTKEIQQRNNRVPKSLRRIYVSGSILEISVLEMAKQAFDGIEIFNVYGLTEAGPRVAAQIVDYCTGTSVGIPIDGVSVMIADEKGIRQNVGIKGTVFVKTPCRFMGYVSNENDVDFEKDEWLNTGDYGYITENHELFIIGRNDNCVIYQSHKVYPEEVERVIINTGFFAECFVVLHKTDLVCFYSTENQKCLTEIEIQRTIQCCKKVLPAYEIPRKFVFVNHLKRNSNGKIIRRSECYEL